MLPFIVDSRGAKLGLPVLLYWIAGSVGVLIYHLVLTSPKNTEAGATLLMMTPFALVVFVGGFVCSIVLLAGKPTSEDKAFLTGCGTLLSGSIGVILAACAATLTQLHPNAGADVGLALLTGLVAGIAVLLATGLARLAVRTHKAKLPFHFLWSGGFFVSGTFLFALYAHLPWDWFSGWLTVNILCGLMMCFVLNRPENTSAATKKLRRTKKKA